MNMAQPLPDKNYTPKKSTGSKVLIGCGIGCATIIGLILIIVGFAGWWFFSSEDQAPTDRILNPGSSAAFRLEDISKNPGAMQLISDVFKEANSMSRNQSHVQFPEPLIKLQKYFDTHQDPVQFVKIFIPKEATASMTTDEAGNPVFLIAANFGTGTRMAKMLLNTAFENNNELKDGKISTDHGELYLFKRK